MRGMVRMAWMKTNKVDSMTFDKILCHLPGQSSSCPIYSVTADFLPWDCKKTLESNQVKHFLPWDCQKHWKVIKSQL